MRKVTAALLLGITIGTIGTILVRRLQQIAENEDPEALLDRISNQLGTLESRFNDA